MVIIQNDPCGLDEGAVTYQCFYCGKDIDLPCIMWFSMESLGTFIHFHSRCVLEFTIGLLRDVNEARCMIAMNLISSNVAMKTYKTARKTFSDADRVSNAKNIDYQEYIHSKEWKRKAYVAKLRVDWRCQVCNKHSNDIQLDAHHRTYERLGKELPEDITVLCRNCHELYETNRKQKQEKQTPQPEETVPTWS